MIFMGSPSEFNPYLLISLVIIKKRMCSHGFKLLSRLTPLFLCVFRRDILHFPWSLIQATAHQADPRGSPSPGPVCAMSPGGSECALTSSLCAPGDSHEQCLRISDNCEHPTMPLAVGGVLLGCSKLAIAGIMFRDLKS